MRPTKGGAGVLVGRGVGGVVGLAVGRGAGRVVAVGVFEGSGVGVMVGLRVGVGVSVGMGVLVATGVGVGVLDGVGVGEGVRVRVAVTVAVKVGLGVRVGVADGPACRSGRNCDSEQAMVIQASRMTIATIARRFFIYSPVDGSSRASGMPDSIRHIIIGMQVFGKKQEIARGDRGPARLSVLEYTISSSEPRPRGHGSQEQLRVGYPGV